MSSFNIPVPGGEKHIHIHLNLSPSTAPSSPIVGPNGFPAREYIGTGDQKQTLSAATNNDTATIAPTISDAAPESIEVQNAIMILKTNFASEVNAVLLGCFVLQTREKKSDVCTSKVSDFLRNEIGGYKMSNPTALINSLAKRKKGGLEIFGKTEGRSPNLMFGLTEENMAAIRESLTPRQG